MDQQKANWELRLKTVTNQLDFLQGELDKMRAIKNELMQAVKESSDGQDPEKL